MSLSLNQFHPTLRLHVELQIELEHLHWRTTSFVDVPKLESPKTLKPVSFIKKGEKDVDFTTLVIRAKELDAYLGLDHLNLLFKKGNEVPDMVKGLGRIFIFPGIVGSTRGVRSTLCAYWMDERTPCVDAIPTEALFDRFDRLLRP